MAKDSEKKRLEMIKYAFEVWGKSAFFNTSLKHVAQKFNITKQGLMRHFKTKDILFEALANYFFKLYFNMLDQIINLKTQNLDIERFIEFYVEKHLNFFLNNISFFFFFTSPIFKKFYLKNENIFQYEQKQAEIFKELLLKHGLSLKNFDFVFFIQYIYITIFFFILKFLKIEKGEKKIILPIFNFNEEQKNEIIKKIKKIILNGFGNKNDFNIDFTKIEQEFTIKKEDIPQRDKIFNAITKVVAESSIWGASLEKIAKEVGMNKSTLFYYFKNKKEIFNSLLIEEILRIGNIFLSKVNKTRPFEEWLYASMVLDYSYFLNDVNTLHYFNWLHFQKLKGFNFNFNLMENNKLKEHFEKKYFFILQALQNDLLKTYDLTPKEIIAFLNMQFIIKFTLDIERKRDVSFNNVRRDFLMFLYGIKKEIV